MMTDHWVLWGKARPSVDGGGAEGNTWHPLLCHMIDVAEVARVLLERGLSSRLGARLAAYFDTDQASAHEQLAWLVALHDIGKASPAFQEKVVERRVALDARGFDFDVEPGDAHHGAVSVQLLRSLLRERCGLPVETSVELAYAVGMHHGQAPTGGEVTRIKARQLGKAAAWSNARRHLVDELTAAFPAAARLSFPTQPDASFFFLLAGLTSVADWIGSAVEHFRYAPGIADASAYRTTAADYAQRAVGVAGFRRLPPANVATFVELFGKKPRPLQARTEQIASSLGAGGLIIVEASTGEGKTEAALLLAEHFAANGGQQGYFVALPTQATSNQMLRRVRQHLSSSRPDARVNLQLAHGNAALHTGFQKLRTAAIYDESSSDGVGAEAWFSSRKRTLLAATAVGTIDQALLGVLRTRHAFVRLFGLAGKTVILDEVHAYDTYTSTLIDRLLDWLHAMGASVVLLSATLPRKRRNQLVAAYGGTPTSDGCAYPRLTVVDGGRSSAIPVTSHIQKKKVAIRFVGPETDRVARALASDLHEGGCAAWITNTVARAQEAYSALRELRDTGLLHPDTELGLIHARYPLREREWRERLASRRFGPPGQGGRRPQRSILVGTQVLEQSLDLDFDRMVSDLAPIDLLLQRAGRLHRHERGERPTALKEARLLVVGGTSGDRPEGPVLGAVAGVYDEAVILRTWLALRDRNELTLPEDLEPLIEQVYGDEPLVPETDALKVRLHAVDEASRAAREEAASKAFARMLPLASVQPDLASCDGFFEEDAPEIHPTLQALTRLGGPSVQVVCLYETAAGVALDPAGRRPIDLAKRLDVRTVRALLRRSVAISDRRIVRSFAELSEPPAFRASPLLQRHRVLAFRPDGAPIGPHVLRLDRELGIVFVSGKES